MSLTCLPRRVSQCVRVLGPCFHPRHQRGFSWRLVLPLLDGERANLKALARHGPQHLADQHYRRLRCAAYGCTTTWLWWFADQALQAFPPPEDGILSLVGDRTLKGTRGPTQPVAQKTRLSQHHPDVLGFRLVILMAPWETDRLPVAFARVRRTVDPADETENAWCRHLRQAFRRPAWCHERVVTADAAYASRAHVALLQTLGYGYVMAWPRTWKLAHGTALKARVTHLPRGKSTQLRMPAVNTQRRRTLWVDAKRARRRHRGDVTVVLRTCRRHQGPTPTKSLVTHRPETVTAREVVGVYGCRWWVELLVKERNGVVGLGPHPVTKQPDRIERSVAGAIMASLLLLKRRANDVPADRPWSALRRQRAFAWEVVQAQCERSARQMARKWLQLGKVA
jgi:hypothetical protein